MADKDSKPGEQPGSDTPAGGEDGGQPDIKVDDSQPDKTNQNIRPNKKDGSLGMAIPPDAPGGSDNPPADAKTIKGKDGSLGMAIPPDAPGGTLNPPSDAKVGIISRIVKALRAGPG